MTIAFVFNGQGAQYQGMGKELYDDYLEIRATFEEASKTLGFNLEQICFEENNCLNETRYTQPAILTVSVAISRLLINKFGIKPAYVAGLSLGEYSALVVSGRLSFSDALKIVQQRGKFMTEAVPNNQGSMMAVMGLSSDRIASICQLASSKGLVAPANYNMPNQTVISGELEALAFAKTLLKEAGAKAVIPLNVSGPFHTPLLEPAAKQLEQELTHYQFAKSDIPLISNVTGEVITAENCQSLLVQQVKSPVLWQKSVETLSNEGVSVFIEIGPGTALSHFIKKITKGKTIYNVEKTTHLTELVELKNKGDLIC